MTELHGKKVKGLHLGKPFTGKIYSKTRLTYIEGEYSDGKNMHTVLFYHEREGLIAKGKYSCSFIGLAVEIIKNENLSKICQS